VWFTYSTFKQSKFKIGLVKHFPTLDAKLAGTVIVTLFCFVMEDNSVDPPDTKVLLCSNCDEGCHIICYGNSVTKTESITAAGDKWICKECEVTTSKATQTAKKPKKGTSSHKISRHYPVEFFVILLMHCILCFRAW